MTETAPGRLLSSLVVTHAVVILAFASWLAWSAARHGLEPVTGPGLAVAVLAVVALLALSGVERRRQELLTLREQLRQLSDRDEISGAWNRRATFGILEDELARSVERGHSLSLLVVDLDGFRELARSHGRDAGDRALAETHAALVGAVRQCDAVGRTGNDEFVVVLPGTDRDQGARVARKVLRALGERTVAGRPLAASVGVASRGSRCDTADELVSAADMSRRSARIAGGVRVGVAAIR